MKITNTGRGTRIINAKVDGKLRQVPIEPGATFDGEVIQTKGFKALRERGVFQSPAKAQAEIEAEAKAAADAATAKAKADAEAAAKAKS